MKLFFLILITLPLGLKSQTYWDKEYSLGTTFSNTIGATGWENQHPIFGFEILVMESFFKNLNGVSVGMGFTQCGMAGTTNVIDEFENPLFDTRTTLRYTNLIIPIYYIRQFNIRSSYLQIAAGIQHSVHWTKRFRVFDKNEFEGETFLIENDVRKLNIRMAAELKFFTCAILQDQFKPFFRLGVFRTITNHNLIGNKLYHNGGSLSIGVVM